MVGAFGPVRTGKTIAIAALVAFTGSGNVNAQNGVHVTPYPDPEIETYDPEEGKPEGMPDDEDGYADPHFGHVYEGFDVEYTPDGLKVTKLKPINVLSRPETILPDDADDELKGHEAAHHELWKEEYDKNAKRKIEAAISGFVGKTFTGSGATPEERQADALKQAEADLKGRIDRAVKALGAQGSVANAKFDKLTDHGRGTSDGTEDDGKPLNTEAGLKETRAEKKKAPAAGKAAHIPDQDAYPYVLAANALLELDSDGSTISLSAPATIDGGVLGSDAVLGAAITISDLTFVGWLDNGAGLVGDGSISIADPLTGDLLLDGFLYELAFLPSGFDGFEAMLQGYLDVPPEFAGGIAPDGSDFLMSLVDASEAPARLPMFHFLFDGPLPIDASGNLVASELAGTIKIGIAPVPLPATWPLVLAGVGALAFLARRAAPGRRRQAQEPPSVR